MRRARKAIFAAALLVLLVAGTAPGRLPSGGTRYAGHTSERLPVTLRVAAGGGRVAHMHIRYRVRCSDGARGAPFTDLSDLRIDRHGRFAFTGTYTGRTDGSKNRVELHGTISESRATGTFALSARRKSVRCHSGRVSWHARAAS